MSSKRGRKRNDTLPPNRARDVQRAFRERRAAHLQALEERNQELEDENARLRELLHLPPSNRPPLGRGPTGTDHRDRPSGSGLDRSRRSATSTQSDSPSTARTNSLSPLSTSHPSSSMQSMDSVTSTSWDQGLAMVPDNRSSVEGHRTSAFSPTSRHYVPRLDQPAPARPPNPSGLYLASGSQSHQYSHSSDRPMSSWPSPNISRSEDPYAYAQSSYSSTPVRSSSSLRVLPTPTSALHQSVDTSYTSGQPIQQSHSMFSSRRSGAQQRQFQSVADSFPPSQYSHQIGRPHDGSNSGASHFQMGSGSQRPARSPTHGGPEGSGSNR